jgi:hypothetical protein
VWFTHTAGTTAYVALRAYHSHASSGMWHGSSAIRESERRLCVMLEQEVYDILNFFPHWFWSFALVVFLIKRSTKG